LPILHNIFHGTHFHGFFYPPPGRRLKQTNLSTNNKVGPAHETEFWHVQPMNKSPARPFSGSSEMHPHTVPIFG